MAKKIPIKITNSLFFVNNDSNLSSNSPFLITERNSYNRFSSKKTVPEVKKEANEDLSDPKSLCELLKQNMIYSSINNTKNIKEEIEKVNLILLRNYTTSLINLHFFPNFFAFSRLTTIL